MINSWDDARHPSCAQNHLKQQAKATGHSVVQQAGRDVLNVNLVSNESTQPGLVSVTPPWGKIDHKVRGRAGLVTDVVSALSGPLKSIVVLNGAGGRGKTTVALEAARAAADNGTTVWWASAADRTTLFESTREIALRLGADPSAVDRAWSGRGSAPDVFWRILDQVRSSWLLVIDNADEPEMLASYGSQTAEWTGWLRPPGSGLGAVLVTTRDGNPRSWGRPVQLIPVPALQPDDAAQVLLDLGGPDVGCGVDAAQLAVRLGGLPLALRLAGHYLADAALSPSLPGLSQPRTFADYHAALDTRFGETVDAAYMPRGEKRTARTLVTSTWELSLDLLERRGQAQARPLLRLLACFALAPIPYSVLNAAILANSSLFSQVTPERLLDLLRALMDFGLLEEVREDEEPRASSVVLHPLIRDVNRHYARSENHLTAYVRTLTAILDASCRDIDPDNPADVQAWQNVTLHCSALLQLWGGVEVVKPDLDMAKTASTTCRKNGCFLYRIGRYLQAEQEFSLVLLLQRQVLDEEHRETLFTRYNLARVLRGRGEWPLAEQHFREVLEAQSRVLGEKHPDTLATRNQLGFVLRARGKWHVAEEEFRSVLRSQQQVIGSDHPDTLLTRHNLGYVLYEQGYLADAERELEAVLETRRRVLGDKHAHTLFTRYALTKVLCARREWAVAEQQLRDLIANQQLALGLEHPDTLAARSQLGRALLELGDVASAERELEEVLAIQRRALGVGHPETLSTENDLLKCDPHETLRLDEGR